MKLSLVILSIALVLFSAMPSLSSGSCKKRTELCRGGDDCCPVMGRRLVCAASLEVCGKKICCITEVEEQQEKQAAIFRDRISKSKRFWKLLLDDEQEEDEEY